MQIVTIADITGDGAAHPISSTSQPCKWFQVIGVSIGANPARIGDANVSSSRGAPIVSAGAGQFSPPVAEVMQNYDLAGHYYWAANGDKISVVYAI